MVADPRLSPATAAGMQGIVALCGLSLLLGGALQVAFAWLGLTRLSRVVPRPVLAGFMNSAALLVVLAQVPLLLNLPLGSRPTGGTMAAANPAALALGLGTADTIWLLARRWPRLRHSDGHSHQPQQCSPAAVGLARGLPPCCPCWDPPAWCCCGRTPGAWR